MPIFAFHDTSTLPFLCYLGEMSPCPALRQRHIKHLIGFKCHQREKEMKKGRKEGCTEYAREEIGGEKRKVKEACGGRTT